MDLILYAIPVFLLLILVEFSYGLLCARNTYRLNDTINSLSMGTLSRLQALVIVGTLAGLYEVVATTFGCRSFQNRACGPGYPVLCFTIWRTTGSTDGA